MSPTRRLAVTDVGRFASGEVSGNADREWRLATHFEPRSPQIAASPARLSSRSGRR